MRIFCLIILVAFLGTGCSQFAKVQKSTDYDYKLRMADQYYVKKKYNQAQQLYEELFPLLKGNDKFENVYYNFAYCAYNQRDYTNAENLFKGFTEVFPTSKRAEEMEYMRAYCYYKQSPKVQLDQTNTSRTIGLMQAFINTHPGSEKNKEATEIIDKCHTKLEMKEQESAELYFNLRQFKAAAIAFENLMNNYPDSQKGDEYKLKIIRSYYEYAAFSIEEKKEQRFGKVLEQCNEFTDRFPDSKLKKDVEKYFNLSQNNIKLAKNEQVKTSA
ncbi:outer membrane protein assembly factor BamD [Flavihumibacter profundi]|uniref:outer membrane protein assembly factor BamD n=1 Tax=Flavihumibacter profundi TaxID=2716883 RepID=UPI001CC74DA5|nr:outer membrane protein assembly factor BamD [Flavihumibacter profundi]MBZ5857273.1 outer membrane protein assembly factor BamD [Flavihumibacter profundi]